MGVFSILVDSIGLAIGSLLERSLFVRMMAVFGFVAAVLIYFIGGDDASDMDASVEGHATQGGTGKQ